MKSKINISKARKMVQDYEVGEQNIPAQNYELNLREKAGSSTDVDAFNGSENELQERIKELSCLSKINQLLEENKQIDNGLKQTLDYLVSAMKYPEQAVAWVELDGSQHVSKKFDQPLQNHLISLIKINQVPRGSVTVYYPDGFEFLPEEQNLLDNIARILGFWIFRTEMEEQMQKKNRVLQMISQCSWLMVHETDETNLLNEICKMITGVGGYKMAWIGFAINDPERSILVAAQSGFENGYLDQAHISWADSKLGRGPTGTAIREGKTQVNQDMQTNPGMAPWRKSALKRGFKSSIALPLCEGGNAYGALTLYSAEPFAFKHEEVNLLEELAYALAYAILSKRKSLELEHTSARLAESEERYRDLVDNTPDSIFSMDTEGRFIAVNQSLAKYLHKTPEEIVGKTPGELGIPKEIVQEDILLLERALKGETARAVRTRILSDGTEHVLDITLHPIHDSEERIISVRGNSRDITAEKKAESLFNSKQRIDMVLEASGGAYFEHFPQTDDGFITERVAELFGYRMDDLPVENNIFSWWRQRIHPEDQKKVAEIYGEFLAGRSASSIEYRAMHHSGEWHWYRAVRTVVEIDAENKPVRVAGLLFDITEQRRTEEKLRQSEAQLRAVLDNSPDAIFLKDLNSRMLLTNRATLNIIGKPAEEVIGKTDEQFYDDPDTGRVILENDRRIIASGKTETIEEKVVMPGGTRTFLSVKTPFYDSEGRLTGLIGTARDISESKRIEEALHESEARFRLALRHVPVSLSAQDLDLKFTWAYNQKSAEPDQIIGHTDNDLFKPEEAAHLIEMKRRAISENIELREQLWMDRPTGPMYIDVTFEPIHDESGKVIGVTTATVDLTPIKRAEKALRESEAHLTSILEQLPVGVGVMDKKGKYFLTNSVMKKYVGDVIPSQDAKQRPLWLGCDVSGNPIPPDQWPGARALRGEKVSPGMEFTYTNRVGEEYKLLVSAVPFLAPDKTVQGAITIVQDITESRRIEDELKTSEKKLRELVQYASVGIYEINFRTHRMEAVNDVMTQFTGYSREELLTMDATKLLDEASQARFQERIQSWLSGKPPEENVEYVIRAKDGHLIYAILYVTFTRDASGMPQGASVISFDVTQRKQLELRLRQLNAELETRVQIRTAELQTAYDNLRKSEERYRLLFNSSQDPIMLSTADGSLTDANPAALHMFGWNLDEILKLGWGGLVDKSDPSFARVLEEQLRAGYFKGEMNFKRKNGINFPGEITITSFPDQEGNNHTSLFVRDISERKKSEETIKQHASELEKRVEERTRDLNRLNKELEHANKAKDEFLANMSHELRSPLNGILGMTEVLQDQIQGKMNEMQQWYLSGIETSGRHLLGLINDILDISKIEAGKFEIHPEEVNVSDICQSSLAFIKETAIKKAQRVKFHIDETTAIVNADPKRLKQILVNLLANAVKFTPDNGTIALDVQTDARQDQIRFIVSDTGIGIQEKDLARLFQPFVQVDSSLTREQEGTGLGLALVQKLTDMHNGSVHVESEVGKGSTFTIVLPWNPETKIKPQDTRKETAPKPNRRPTNGSHPAVNILVADDNPTNMFPLIDYLENLGYIIYVAHNGEEAVQMSGSMQPDLILMDVQMPVLDGLEATRRIKSDPKCKSVPVIALTALAMAGDRERCLEAGADEYLSKPVSLKQLANLIGKMVKK